MSRIEKAVKEINSIYDCASRNHPINNIHPLFKLVCVIAYIIIVISYNKYDIIALMPMIVFPIAMLYLGDLSLKDSIKRLKIVLPLVCLIGILNPIFETDRIRISGMVINAGYISMLTLIIKGFYCVFASYFLIATTTIEKICYALRTVKCPKIIVTEILLIYRYITLLLGEVHTVTQAYSLRAPKQKGVHFKAWGSLVGSILLRSLDRANNLFDSMNLRGYNGEFMYAMNKQKIRISDILFVVLWIGAFTIFRKIPVVLYIGNMIGGLFS